ncbi:unnamed protein product [Calicophoron daubneyi]|uniref:Torsin-1A C-terminal domain-containing protein n=1 Tax=Calicophoron daubneyi TaxID=300641 RepID=A0AAV2TGB1_CALDB
MIGVLSLVYFLQFCVGCEAFPFISLAPIPGLIAYMAKTHLECAVRECCAKGVEFNSTGLKEALLHQLHGQHIASDRVYHHVVAHFMDKHPRKALALSFHGYTGVGKNYVSNMIVTNVLKLGTKSRFYHFYDANIHFQHRSKIDEYKPKLLEELRSAVLACPYSIFVFDEVHNMPTGILDVLAPLLEFRDSVDGVDFRKSVFLFLSNTGGKYINQLTYQHLVSGKKRDQLRYTDVDRDLTRSAFNEGGLHSSDLIKKNLITAMVPFLPLEAEHIRECVKDAARQRLVQFTEEMAEFVLSELEWGPENTQFFAVSGCKRVYEKVGFYVQQTAKDSS